MKKIFNKYSITAILFLTIIAITSVGTFIMNSGKLKNAIVDTKGIKEKIKATEKIYSDYLFRFDDYINLWAISQIASGATLYDDAKYGFIIKDTHGKLHFPVGENDLTSPIDETIKFAAKLKEKDVPFVYIQAPDKKLKNYTIFPKGAYNFSNEDADKFLAALNENKVKNYDLREEIISENLDRNLLFYTTDHHWTTKTSFWAYTKVCDYLNKNFDLNIDPQNYYRNIENYKIKEFKNCYLGSQGRRVGSIISGYDDYTFIEPNFKTNYKLYNGLSSTENPIFSGDFHESIVKDKILYGEDKGLNKHASYFEWDYGDLIIVNENIDNDIKIMLIKDSYSLPLAAFLSTAVKEVHMIDLRENGAVIPYDYIDKYDFDAVVMLYNTEVFAPPMFNLTKINP